MDFNWDKLENLFRKIDKYASGKLLVTNLRVIHNLMRELKRYTSELNEYDMFQTAGAWQNEVKKKLKQCKEEKQKLDLLLSWYSETFGNSKTAKWKKEFYEIGSKKDCDEINERNGSMKLIRSKKIDAEIRTGKTVSDLLRKIACDEIISYHAYLSGSKNLHGENWMDVKQQFEEHAKQELEHYEAVMARLYQLGEPVHAVFKTIADACNYYWDVDSEDPKQTAEIAKKAEEEAIEAYNQLLIHIAGSEADQRDFATQRLAKKNLEEEQDHLQDMIHLLEEF